MTVILCISMMLGAYIRRFSSDFEDDDKSKVVLFISLLIVLAIVIAFLTNR